MVVRIGGTSNFSLFGSKSVPEGSGFSTGYDRICRLLKCTRWRNNLAVSHLEHLHLCKALTFPFPTVSRTMVYMLFRTAKLLADLDDTGVILSEKRPQLVPVRDINDDSSSVEEEAILSLDRLEQISNMSSGKTAELWNVSHTLLEDIETWIKVLKRERTEHERVHLGNLAYANAMKVSLSSWSGSAEALMLFIRRLFCFTTSCVALAQ